MMCKNIEKKRRRYLSTKCDREELDSIRLIINKITCANQAADPRNIPLNDKGEIDCTEKQAELFVRGALQSKAEASFLEDMWWKDMISKYKLEGMTFIDFADGSFYIEVEEEKQNGKVE